MGGVFKKAAKLGVTAGATAAGGPVAGAVAGGGMSALENLQGGGNLYSALVNGGLGGIGSYVAPTTPAQIPTNTLLDALNAEHMGFGSQPLYKKQI